MSDIFMISLKAARINAGYSQKEASSIIKVTPQTLRSWESGKTSPPIKKTVELEKLYNISRDRINFF